MAQQQVAALSSTAKSGRSEGAESVCLSLTGGLSLRMQVPEHPRPMQRKKLIVQRVSCTSVCLCASVVCLSTSAFLSVYLSALSGDICLSVCYLFVHHVWQCLEKKKLRHLLLPSSHVNLRTLPFPQAFAMFHLSATSRRLSFCSSTGFVCFDSARVSRSACFLQCIFFCHLSRFREHHKNLWTCRNESDTYCRLFKSTTTERKLNSCTHRNDNIHITTNSQALKAQISPKETPAENLASTSNTTSTHSPLACAPLKPPHPQSCLLPSPVLPVWNKV